jgi:hypothetical protein
VPSKRLEEIVPLLQAVNAVPRTKAAIINLFILFILWGY